MVFLHESGKNPFKTGFSERNVVKYISNTSLLKNDKDIDSNSLKLLEWIKMA